VDAAGRRYPAVARGPGRPGVPGVRVCPPARARDRHGGARGAAATGAAPGSRGSHAGPLRHGDAARFGAAGGRDRRRAGGPGPAPAAAAPGPGPRGGRQGGARAARGRVVRRRDRGRVRGRAHARPPDLDGVRGSGPEGAAGHGGVRGQRGRRRAAGARPGAGRDRPVGVSARVPDRRPGGAAGPQVRQPRAGRQSRPAAGERAHPPGGIGPDAGAGAARRGSDAVRGGRETGRRRGGRPLPRAADRRVRVLSFRGAGWRRRPRRRSRSRRRCTAPGACRPRRRREPGRRPFRPGGRRPRPRTGPGWPARRTDR
jgi:hypothetical protein